MYKLSLRTENYNIRILIIYIIGIILKYFGMIPITSSDFSQIVLKIIHLQILLIIIILIY